MVTASFAFWKTLQRRVLECREACCKKLAESAIMSIEEARKQTGETMTAFRKLARETGRVGMLKRGLWSDLEIQHMSASLKDMCEFTNDKGKLKETDVYSGGGDGNIQDLMCCIGL